MQDMVSRIMHIPSAQNYVLDNKSDSGSVQQWYTIDCTLYTYIVGDFTDNTNDCSSRGKTSARGSEYSTTMPQRD